MSNWTPRDYQLEAAKFLINRPHAGLLLDMGLGKTSICLAVMSALLGKFGDIRVLLIGPIRTLYTTWPDEITRWGFPLSYYNCHEDPEGIYHTKANIYGINPESSLKMLRDPRFLAQKFDLLVVDESSLYKNPSSVRFKLLREHLHRFPRRWILTGTPAPNGLIDIWSQIFILDRGKALGEYITRFRTAFCNLGYDGYTYNLIPGGDKEIYRRIKPLCLRMEAGDHLDMPLLVKNRVGVKLDSTSMGLYRDMESKFIILLEAEDEEIMSPNTATAGMRCRQIANGGIYNHSGEARFIHDTKTDALKELVEELQGNPTLVFYEFHHDRARIEAALGPLPSPTPETVRLFQQGKIPVLASHPGSISHGLNLQNKCHNVIWYGIPWDLQAYDQSIARVWRQGQEAERVFVHHIVAEDTLDDTVLETLALKSRTQNTLLKALKRRPK